MYVLEKKNIGIKMFQFINTIDSFKPLNQQQRGIIRDNATAEVYQLMVQRGHDGYYLSVYFRTLHDMGLIEP